MPTSSRRSGWPSRGCVAQRTGGPGGRASRTPEPWEQAANPGQRTIRASSALIKRARNRAYHRPTGRLARIGLIVDAVVQRVEEERDPCAHYDRNRGVEQHVQEAPQRAG